jgi:uncharacterized repeat protein (TIGR01451 family)
MNSKFENLAMNYRRKCALKASRVIPLLIAVILSALITGNATAKSLYVLCNVGGLSQPLQMYDIKSDGTLTFQEQYIIPRYNMGSSGVAMDSDSGYLFVIYKYWNYVLVINSKTMIAKDMVQAPGAQSLSGIAYDYRKNLLYCVSRGSSRLWVYNWNPDTAALTLVEGAPFTLKKATARGIAVDEIDQLLYMTNSTNKVNVYNTTDWSLERTITLNRAVECIALDVKNGYLYAGGGYIGNPYLTQYHVSSGRLLETVVEPDAIAGVAGVAVDPNSSKVYVATDYDSIQSSGNKIRIYDKLLYPIDVVNNVTNPSCLVIPGKEIGYNPLGLKKSVVKVVNGDGSDNNSIDAGDLVTYRICFSNKDNDFTVQDVFIEDNLPDEVTFISASDDGIYGQYNPVTHIYTWLYPTLVTGSSACLDITVKVNDNVPPRTTIVNSVTINSNTTPQTTTNSEIVTASNPLKVKKTVFGAIDGQAKWVDVNEVITYDIYVSNNDNDFPATDVIITDTLPDNEVFIKADDDNVLGLYDSATHTFTWSIPSLAPREALYLGITVRLKDGVPEGTTVTNTVSTSSVETASSSSSADIRVGQGPLMVKSVQVSPSTIRRDSALTGIMVIVEMPQDYNVKDIKNTPLLLSVVGDQNAMSVPANSDQLVTSSLGKTYIIAVFDKNLVMDAIEGYGPKIIQIEGTLTNGGYFAGSATINISRFAGS